MYSAGELFTLLQKDLGSSLVVEVDRATGAGSAFPINYRMFQAGTPSVVITDQLPRDGDFRFAFGRFNGIRTLTGKLLEHFAISPDVRYYRSKNDLLNDEKELFNFLAGKLDSRTM